MSIAGNPSMRERARSPSLWAWTSVWRWAPWQTLQRELLDRIDGTRISNESGTPHTSVGNRGRPRAYETP